MKIHGGVKMLAMIVALFLSLGASDSLVVDKCELGNTLNFTLPGQLLDQFSNLVAKIVCHAELSSLFNTSTISYVGEPSTDSSIYKDQHKHKESHAESHSIESSMEDSDSSSKHQRSSSSKHESSNDESSNDQSSNDESSNDESSNDQSSNESSNDESSNDESSNDESSKDEYNGRNSWILYGLFQLPGHIACTSGLDPSLNLCNMNCDELIDDNIGDDITCIETLLSNMYHVIFQKECTDVEDFEYFSSCY